MSDSETIAVYDAQTDAYETMMTEYAAKDPRIGDFINACPSGGQVLDLGCGPGAYARLMAQAGLRVTALDASLEMVRRAGLFEGVTARHGVFEDIGDTAAFDGIWASFSLLHATRAEFPAHLARLHRALKPAGIFFLGMKTGTGGGRDELGRYYEYYSKEALETYMSEAGFTVKRHWTGYGKGLAGQYSGFITLSAHA